ncbi:MAG TPA: hypothetical protein VF817_00965 [Patescibacteria group bacterium]
MREKNGKLKAVVVRGFSEHNMEAIKGLRSLFPKTVRNTDEQIRRNLANPENLNMFLMCGDEVVGYILGTPHADAISELKDTQDERYMSPDPRNERTYIDQMALKPSGRAHGNFLVLVISFLNELWSKGKCKISSHILADQGLDRAVTMAFGRMLTKKKSIKLMCHQGKEFLYIEGTYVK